MRILKRPAQLWITALLALPALPLLLLNGALLQRTTLLAFTRSSSFSSVLIAALLTTLSLSLCVIMAFPFSLPLFGALSTGVFIVNFVGLILTKNYGLAFFGLGWMLLSLMFYFRMKSVLTLSYFTPRVKWFESYPRMLPKIRGTLRQNEATKPLEVSLSSLDEQGCFLFKSSSSGENQETWTSGVLTLLLEDDDSRSWTGPVRAISCVGHNGFGYQFLPKSADDEKELMDFIEFLKGRGYV